MKLLPLPLFCLFLVISNSTFCQNKEYFKAINTHIWENFTKAFETHDVALFSSLHTEDLVRVSGDGKTIREKTAYIEGYKTRWQNKPVPQTISFRFLERICNGKQASERGIYKLTRYPNTPDEVSYYGKFHVILKRESNLWKIQVDYDSSEQNTIDETTFKSAFALYDFERF